MEPQPRHAYTIRRDDIGKRTLVIDGRTLVLCGAVLPIDVGKRIYVIGTILQMEDQESRDARFGR